MADLIKFNTHMAHSFYKVSEEDGLETVLFALQAEEDVKVRLPDHCLPDTSTHLPPEAGCEPRCCCGLLRGGGVQGPSAARGPGHHQPGEEAVPVAPAGRLPLRPRYSTTSTSLPHSSLSAQTALMTSLLGLAIKLTGKRPSRLDTKLKLPGGKMPGKARGEVLAYLALIQNIADAMAEANGGYKNKSAHLRRMHADLVKITANF